MALTFSAAQFEAIGRASYLQRMLDLIRGQYANQAEGLGDTSLREAIWEQTQLAGRYGLDDEQSAATFVLTAWLLGKGFDRRIPALAQILDSDQLCAADKAQALHDFTLVLFSTLGRSPTAPQGRQA